MGYCSNQSRANKTYLLSRVITCQSLLQISPQSGLEDGVGGGHAEDGSDVGAQIVSRRGDSHVCSGDAGCQRDETGRLDESIAETTKTFSI